MTSTSLKIGFLGTGKMAIALAKGFVGNGVPSGHIYAANPNPNSLKAFQSEVSSDVVIATCLTNWIDQVDVLFLAVKPHIMPSVLEKIGQRIPNSALVVSVATGLSIQKLEDWLPNGSRVVRVMPNTPCLVGQGASGVSKGSQTQDSDLQTVCNLMETVGMVACVEERLLDAVTGLSGSGPAYVFQMIEALSDGGVKMGLPRTIATELAARTLMGAAAMVLETGQHPGELKDAVTSPGGTTIAALHALEKGNLRSTLMDAVEASTSRSQEIGK